MAYALPGSTFLGIDSAARPTSAGNRAIAELGLPNVSLRQDDIEKFRADPASFDYVIAHGIYSWVSPAVRDRILAICREYLSPNGVAYVSYNTYPGCHLRNMVREMMLFHVRDRSSANDKINQGRALLAFLVDSKSSPIFTGRCWRRNSSTSGSGATRHSITTI